MKKLFLYIIGAGLLTTACDMESSKNGDLDGLWQLSQVDTLATGSSTDMRASQITWAVQGVILETRLATSYDVQNDIIFRFSHTADSLVLYSPYFSDRHNGDVRVEDVNQLRPFGVSRLEEHFKVQELSSSTMTLQSQELRLWFRKY